MSCTSSNQFQLLDSLLDDIYSHHGSVISTGSSDSTGHITTADSDNTMNFSIYESSFSTCHMLSISALESKSISELKEIQSKLITDTNQISSKLVRLLKQRDLTNRKIEQSANILTAILQATSDKTAADAKLSFTLAASPGESGWQKWIDAMRAISRLPGGIPDQFRRKLWVGLADNYLEANRIDWNSVSRTAFNDKSNPDDSALGLQIVKDLHRTGCSNSFLPENYDVDTERTLLKRVLLAYARWNKQVGYCQGFNVLATVILDTVDRNELDALKVMIYLIDHVLPANYYAHCLRLLAVDLAVFRHLLSANLPLLAQHLDKLQKRATCADDGIFYEPPLTNVFLMQWLLTLYATCLPKHALLRLWDCLLLNGSDALLSAGLHIFAKLSKQILSCQTVDQYYTTMERFSKTGILNEPKPGVVSEADSFIQAVYKPLTPSVGELREQLLYSIQPFMSPSSTLPSTSSSTLFQSGEQTNSEKSTLLGCFSASGSALLCNRSKQNADFNRQNEAFISGLTDDQLRELGAVRERMTTDLKKLRRNYERLAKHRNLSHVIVPSVLDPTSAEAHDTIKQINVESSQIFTRSQHLSHFSNQTIHACFLAPTFGGGVINHLLVSKAGLEEVNQKVMAAPVLEMIAPTYSDSSSECVTPVLSSPSSSRRKFSAFVQPRCTSTALKYNPNLNEDTGISTFHDETTGRSEVMASPSNYHLETFDTTASLQTSPAVSSSKSLSLDHQDGLVEIDISSNFDQSQHFHDNHSSIHESSDFNNSEELIHSDSMHAYYYYSDENENNENNTYNGRRQLSVSNRRRKRLDAFFDRFGSVSEAPKPGLSNLASSCYVDSLNSSSKSGGSDTNCHIASPFPVSAAERLKQRLRRIPGVSYQIGNQ